MIKLYNYSSVLIFDLRTSVTSKQSFFNYLEMENNTALSILKGNITNDCCQSFLLTFKKIVENNSNKIATLYEDEDGNQNSISFKHMDELSDKIATILHQFSNYQKSVDNTVAVFLKPTQYLPVVLIAIMKAGMAYLPLDTEFPVNRIKHILEDAQPIISIIEKTADKNLFQKTTTLTIEELLVKSKIKSSKNIIVNEDVHKIALILYTSGSTGVPKGVRLQYSALMNRLTWQWKELPYKNDEDICIFKTALTFVDSVCEIWGPLLQGRTLVVVPKNTTRDPAKFINILNKYKVKRLVLVPSLLRSLLIYLRLQENKKNLLSLQLWICSGEKLLAKLVQEFFAWFDGQNKTIANFYGSTEIMGDVTYYLIHETDMYLKKNEVPIGRPIDNCVIYITDSDLNIVPQGHVGELIMTGKNLAKGYVNDENSKKFINNIFSTQTEYSKLFRTGDYAQIKDNLLFYEGRLDNQVKIRGHRINLSEIDKAVSDLPTVKDAVTLSYKTNETDQVLLCFVVPKFQESNLQPNEITSLLTKTLSEHMMPQVIIISSIPLLINGKTDRQKLLNYYETTILESTKKTINQIYDYTDVPQDLMKKAEILYSTLSSVIKISNKNKISIHSNFYELGGNSLNSVYTVSKLREKGITIGITDFITAKCIKDILVKMKTNDSIEVTEDNVEFEKYSMEMLNDSHKEDVIKMITESFLTKADLERWLIPDIKREDYFNLMQEIWNPLVEKNFSFVIKSLTDNQILSVALNFDATDEPEVNIKSKLSVIFDFLEYLEKPIRETQLPQGEKKIFHTFMMATSDELHASENVILMRLMEQKCLEVAKKNGFLGIFTTNTSPLTQQLGTDVFNYEVLLDYQVNQYTTSTGWKPFSKASDDQRAIVSWKRINYT